MVMKRKLQLESPISNAVAKAGKEGQNVGLLEDKHLAIHVLGAEGIGNKKVVF